MPQGMESESAPAGHWGAGRWRWMRFDLCAYDGGTKHRMPKAEPTQDTHRKTHTKTSNEEDGQADAFGIQVFPSWIPALKAVHDVIVVSNYKWTKGLINLSLINKNNWGKNMLCFKSNKGNSGCAVIRK